MDIQTAIDMLARLEHMADELDAGGLRIVVDVKLDTSVRLEALAAGTNGGG